MNYSFGEPTGSEPRSLIKDLYSHIEEKVSESELKNGVSITVLEDTLIQGITVDLINARIAPGKKVGAHLHEQDGEIEFPLTPVLSVIGETKKDSEGNYILDDEGNIEQTITEQKIQYPGVPLKIPEGIVHEFRNPMSDAYADIMFFIPHTHVNAEDKRLAVSPDLDIPTIQKFVEDFLNSN